MAWLGLLIGGLIGSSWGFKSTLIGALLGALVGSYLRKSTTKPVDRVPASDPAAIPVRKGGAGSPPPGWPAAPAARVDATAATATDTNISSGEQEPPLAASVDAPAPASSVASTTSFIASAPDAPPLSAPSPKPPTSNPLWSWFTGGNALTRIGVVVLFFGVAFLLRYLADIVTVSIEVKLVLVGAVGLTLIALGVKLARVPVRARAGYGLSLQGAGAGMLYLTVFAAIRLYHVLPLVPGLLLLAAVAALTVWLAVRADSQPLAGLAVAGGFLAPMLTEVNAEPLPLLGYFAVLNAAIFVLAWMRSWRALNVLGFVFTFVLGSVWGYRSYVPEYWSTVEPFLILFFVFYVGIAMLYAHRGRLEARAPVDGLLVFGTPLVGFALQAALVRNIPYGSAWSAAALASIYAVLFAILRRRAEPGLALLARAFLTLAVIFATIAIPLAFDYRITAALWAVAAAGVYWLGLRQDTPLVRAFALLVQVGAGVVFLLAKTTSADDILFANPFFVGAALVALAALVSAWLADAAGERLRASERGFTPLVFLWGAAWWLVGGAYELRRHLDQTDALHATLAWVAGSVALALLLRYLLRWPRLLSFAIALLPTMGIIALRDFQLLRTTVEHFGWILWPLAWIVQWCALKAADARLADTAAPGVESGAAGAAVVGSATFAEASALRGAHALSALGLIAQIAWQLSEWVDTIAPSGTVWLACAAILPLIVYLSFTPWFATVRRWPLTQHRDAYTLGAGRPVALLVAVWLVVAALTSPGNAAPLTYVPILNPLELTLALGLAALFVWTHRFGRWDPTTMYGSLGLALFVILNGIALRTAHHWGDIPWRLSSLLGSKLLQAGLTLAWTTTGVALMAAATRMALRTFWMLGAALVAVAVGKLFLVDLGALSGLPRVVAFLGVGVLLLLIGYWSPLPPARDASSTPGGNSPST